MGDIIEVPLIKGDLGGSKSGTQPIAASSPSVVIPPRPPSKGGNQKARGEPTALPTFKFEYATLGIEGGIFKHNINIQKHSGTAPYYRETINGVALDLVQIRGGSFDMGSNEYNSEKPIHRVTVRDFFMGKYPVTQAQWKAVASLQQQQRELNPDPSHFKGDDRPVEQVSWDDAVEFCDRLTAHTGKRYRLPSEAEWEYACRAGTTTPFHFGETIDAAIANYDATSTYGKGKKGEYRQQTTPVGSLPANAWGLFDCHGNVWEWCWDDWHTNYQNAPSNGTAWVNDKDTGYKIMRGGSWGSNPVFCRSANRNYNTRGNRNHNCGFRVVLCGVGGSPSTLHFQNWPMGMVRACPRRVQTCSRDVGAPISENHTGWGGLVERWVKLPA